MTVRVLLTGNMAKAAKIGSRVLFCAAVLAPGVVSLYVAFLMILFALFLFVKESLPVPAAILFAAGAVLARFGIRAVMDGFTDIMVAWRGGRK